MNTMTFREKYVFWALLISLVLAFTITPFLSSDLQSHKIFMLSSMALAIIAIADRKSSFIVGVILGVPAIIFSFLTTMEMGWLGASETGDLVSFYVASSLFFAYVIFCLFKFIFKKKIVSANKLLASICIYFLLAAFWATLYGLIYILVPESFDFHGSGQLEGTKDDFMYFSIVTITTLGYGDITPLSAQARSAASMEALTGQIYLTVLVARLVALHIASNIQLPEEK